MTSTRFAAAAEPVVDVRDAFCLHRVGDGAVAALRGLSLEVAAGERVVVHGPNGSGKTTLLRTLIGEQRLSAGTAVVAGWPVGVGPRGGLAEWRARSLGWVDQHAGRTLRPEFDVIGNVMLQVLMLRRSRAQAREAAIEALERVGVADLADRQITDLSGGEAQRVAVAAAIVHYPTVVFADEPGGQLDAVSADAVYQALSDAVQGIGAALVMVSHDRRATVVADKVMWIRDGRMSEAWWPNGGGPAAAPDEQFLVVDSRGWLRLPEAARRSTGTGDVTRFRVDGDQIVLNPVSTQPAGDRAAFPPPSGPPSPISPPPRSHAPRRPHESSRPHESTPASRSAEPSVAPSDPVGGHGVRATARLTEVTRSFGDRLVVRPLNLAVGGGAIHVVGGRSGAGKSTILRMLVGLDRPSSGDVSLAGVDLASLDREALARHRRDHVGVVLQEIHLAETATVAGNLDLARSARGLRRDGADDQRWLDSLDIGHLARREARRCSGGERQRVALARAMIARPAIVVLDEPSSQLDEAATERLVAVLRLATQAGAAVVIATHDPVLIAAADVLVDLDLGAC